MKTRGIITKSAAHIFVRELAGGIIDLHMNGEYVHLHPKCLEELIDLLSEYRVKTKTRQYVAVIEKVRRGQFRIPVEDFVKSDVWLPISQLLSKVESVKQTDDGHKMVIAISPEFVEVNPDDEPPEYMLVRESSGNRFAKLAPEGNFIRKGMFTISQEIFHDEKLWSLIHKELIIIDHTQENDDDGVIVSARSNHFDLANPGLPTPRYELIMFNEFGTGQAVKFERKDI